MHTVHFYRFSEIKICIFISVAEPEKISIILVEP
jgi:hypothetical protein